MNEHTTINGSESNEVEVVNRGLVAQLREVFALEHPSVVGARAGACLFCCLVFPAAGWAVGAVSLPGALLIAAAAACLDARTIVLHGGTAIMRVLGLEIGIAAVACVLAPEFSLVPGVLAATAFALIGMFACVSMGARAGDAWFEQLARPFELDVVIARATAA